MPLGALRSVGATGTRKPGHGPYRATLGACPVRGRRLQYKVVKKARISRLQCQPRESGRRRGGGSTAGDSRDGRRHALGSLVAESILVFGNALPFAGRCRNEDLGRFKESEGDSNPSKTPNRWPWGARGFFEEGNLYPPRHAASHARRGEVLRSGYLGSREGLSSFQPAVAASGDWFDAPSASGASKSGGLRGSTSRRACSAEWWALSGFAWLTARHLREEAAYASRATSKEAARGARANA